jgi:hypothetical protein
MERQKETKMKLDSEEEKQLKEEVRWKEGQER